MKKLNMLMIGLMSLAFIGCKSMAQEPARSAGPAEPAEPAPPAPPARPVRAAKPVPPAPPAKPISIEDQLAASHEALNKAKMQFDFADANWGRTFGRLDVGSRTVVIPRDAEDSKETAETEKDLKVMARILEKALSKPKDYNAEAMGIVIHNPFGGQFAQSLYIDGYGALFFLNVNFPLVPPATETKEETEKREQKRSEWEATQDELFHPRGPDSDLNGPFGKTTSAPAGEKYDAEKVEALKRNLVDALKNASHIHALKSDEFVTVVVTSHSGLAGASTVKRMTMEKDSVIRTDEEKSPAARNLPARKVRVPGESGAKLIIRAKKKDIAAFEENKMDADAFRKRVNLMLIEGA